MENKFIYNRNDSKINKYCKSFKKYFILINFDNLI